MLSNAAEDGGVLLSCLSRSYLHDKTTKSGIKRFLESCIVVSSTISGKIWKLSRIITPKCFVPSPKRRRRRASLAAAVGIANFFFPEEETSSSKICLEEENLWKVSNLSANNREWWSALTEIADERTQPKSWNREKILLQPNYEAAQI